MDASGCAPTVTTYEALIKALGDSGELEKALAVFQSMGARGVKPQASRSPRNETSTVFCGPQSLERRA